MKETARRIEIKIDNRERTTTEDATKAEVRAIRANDTTVKRDSPMNAATGMKLNSEKIAMKVVESGYSLKKEVEALIAGRAYVCSK